MIQHAFYATTHSCVVKVCGRQLQAEFIEHSSRAILC